MSKQKRNTRRHLHAARRRAERDASRDAKEQKTENKEQDAAWRDALRTMRGCEPR